MRRAAAEGPATGIQDAVDALAVEGLDVLGVLLLLGLDLLEITPDPDNLASQKVILANGGMLVGRFAKAAAYGGAESLKYRIDL